MRLLFDRNLVRILLAIIVITGANGFNIPNIWGNQAVGLPAKVVGGEVYVKADSLTESLGGTGTFIADKNTFYYTGSNPVEDVIERISPAVVAIIGKPISDNSKPSDRFD